MRSSQALALIAVLVLKFSISFADPNIAQQNLSGDSQKYYTTQFLSLIQDRSTGNSDQIVQEIKNILRKGHIRTAGNDQLTESCATATAQVQCYQHISIGYNAARVFLMGKFYLSNHGNQYFVHDVYCGRDYGPQDFPNGEAPAPNAIPAHNVINVEHTWPQSRFTKLFPNEMQKSDLHHLFPADSTLNSTRGSFDFGNVVQDVQVLKCPISRFGHPQDSTAMVFQPPAEHRGNVARALFYFSVKYDIHLPPQEEAALRQWDLDDPIDAEEMRRNDAIFETQKSRNPFVDIPGLARQINRF